MLRIVTGKETVEEPEADVELKAVKRVRKPARKGLSMGDPRFFDDLV